MRCPAGRPLVTFLVIAFRSWPNCTKCTWSALRCKLSTEHAQNSSGQQGWHRIVASEVSTSISVNGTAATVCLLAPFYRPPRTSSSSQSFAREGAGGDCHSSKSQTFLHQFRYTRPRPPYPESSCRPFPSGFRVMLC